MNKEDLTKLWKWVSLGCFAYVIGSLISIQGGVDVFRRRCSRILRRMAVKSWRTLR